MSPYEGVDVAWVAVIKMANLLPEKSEHARMLSLLNVLPEESVKDLLSDPAVDELLNLQPPLEAVLSNQYERLDAEHTSHELNEVRRLRTTDPKASLVNLAHILKRVRNSRAHGFKTPEGPRDKIILSASLKLLRNLGGLAAEYLGAK